MAIITMLLSSALYLSSQQPEVGLGTIYGYKGDAYNQYGTYACQAVITQKYGRNQWAQALKYGVAHRTLPCGKAIIVCNRRNHLCATMYVVDRGPYGAIDQYGKWRPATKLKPGEKYRGVIDMLPNAAAAIALNGLDRVSIWQQ